MPIDAESAAEGTKEYEKERESVCVCEIDNIACYLLCA